MKDRDFSFGIDGLRTQKTVQTDWLPETTNYYLHGKLLTHMTVDYTDFDEVAHQACTGMTAIAVYP